MPDKPESQTSQEPFVQLGDVLVSLEPLSMSERLLTDPSTYEFGGRVAMITSVDNPQSTVQT